MAPEQASGQVDLVDERTGELAEANETLTKSIDRYQSLFDGMLKGKSDERSGNLKMVPGGAGTGINQLLLP